MYIFPAYLIFCIMRNLVILYFINVNSAQGLFVWIIISASGGAVSQL